MNKKILAAIIEDDYLKWQKIFLTRPDAVMFMDTLDESMIPALSAISRGLIKGFAIELIKTYMDKDPETQSRIIDGYAEGLALEDIELTLDPALGFEHAAWVRFALKNGVDKKLIKKYTSRILRLDEYQLREVFKGLVDGLEEKYVDVYAKWHVFSGCDVTSLREWLQTSEEAKKYADQGFDGLALYQIYLAIQAKLSKKEIAFIANPKLDAAQIKLIRESIMDGMDYTKIPQSVLNPDLSPEELVILIRAVKSGVTEEQLKVIINEKFNFNQMSCLEYGFTNLKLSIEQVSLAANPEYDVHEIDNILYGFSIGLTEEQVKLYAIPHAPFNPILVRKGLEAKLSDEQISYLMNAKKWQAYVLDSLIDGFSFEQIEVYLDGDFCDAQVSQIYSGLKQGLSIEQVKTYTKPKYSSDKMKQMKEKLLGQKLIEDFKLTCD